MNNPEEEEFDSLYAPGAEAIYEDEEYHVPEDELDELSKEFVIQLIDKIMMFMEALVGYELHPYQKPLARRIIESVIINDGEEITALAAR